MQSKIDYDQNYQALASGPKPPSSRSVRGDDDFVAYKSSRTDSMLELEGGLNDSQDGDDNDKKSEEEEDDSNLTEHEKLKKKIKKMNGALGEKYE